MRFGRTRSALAAALFNGRSGTFGRFRHSAASRLRQTRVEALQLHARAIRIRHKTVGVWNAMVAETLFNVSLIYKDEKDLRSAMQVCRGCCRVYAEVLGSGHQDTADAEEYLNELHDLARGGKGRASCSSWRLVPRGVDLVDRGPLRGAVNPFCTVCKHK